VRSGVSQFWGGWLIWGCGEGSIGGAYTASW
jgi:hypothetical protein